MWWSKDKTLLNNRLQELQSELETEQGKAAKLAGFLGRLQSFGAAPQGAFAQRAFAESVVDALHVLVQADQVVFLMANPVTLEYMPLAARGLAPQVFHQAHLRTAEDVLQAIGKPSAHHIIRAHGRPIGLLAVARAGKKAFSPEENITLALLGAESAALLSLEKLDKDLREARAQAVASLLMALNAKDRGTHSHARRTHRLIRPFANELSLPDVLIQQIEDGALLHDIGKIGIEDAILQKPAAFTDKERDVMQTHARLGFHIVEPIAALHPVGAIVLYHQEWYNGAGYPDGLAGEEIPLGARIVQIADAWDAMTSDRPYRKALAKTQAIAELRRQAGSQFDPKLVEIFLRVLDRLEREGLPTTEAADIKPLAAQKA